MPRFTILPVQGPLSAAFGQTDDAHPTPHAGADFAVDKGTPIMAPAPGSVAVASAVFDATAFNAIFGDYIIMKHEDCFTLYAHLMDAPMLTAGEKLAAGDVLGYVGSTGQSTGPHLHWGCAPLDNPWFSKDADGGVSRLLDPMAYVRWIDEYPPTEQQPATTPAIEELAASLSAWIAKVDECIAAGAPRAAINTMLDDVIARATAMKEA